MVTFPAWVIPRTRFGRLLLQLAGVAFIFGVDRGINYHGQNLLLAAAIDLPLHLLTALVLLAAARCSVNTRFWWGAAVGSVFIDLDHIPGTLGSSFLYYGGGRPCTHSLLTVGLLFLAARATSGAGRDVLQGLAVGVILHFVRDITDGGTIPLLWPLLNRGFSLPYPFYVLTLLSVPLLGIFVEPGTSEDDAGSAARHAGAA